METNKLQNFEKKKKNNTDYLTLKTPNFPNGGRKHKGWYFS